MKIGESQEDGPFLRDHVMPITVKTPIRRLTQGEFGEIAYEVMGVVYRLQWMSSSVVGYSFEDNRSVIRITSASPGRDSVMRRT